MADTAVVVASISAASALGVAVLGAASGLFQSRSRQSEPQQAAATPNDVAALSAGLQALVREKDEQEQRHKDELDVWVRRALQCEFTLAEQQNPDGP